MIVEAVTDNRLTNASCRAFFKGYVTHKIHILKVSKGIWM